MKTCPLTENHIKEYLDLKKKLNTLDKKIERRVNYIIHIIHKTFLSSMRWGWYFPNAEEGERGTVNLSDDYINFILNDPRSFRTTNFDFTNSFPKEFLFMTDKEIIDFISRDTQYCSIGGDDK